MGILDAEELGFGGCNGIMRGKERIAGEVQSKLHGLGEILMQRKARRALTTTEFKIEGTFCAMAC